MVKLLVTAGPALGGEISVEHELAIGRQAEEKGQLAGDLEISRQHARISRQADGTYVIEDLGSTNGTRVNGHQIDQPLTLSRGDTIEVGGTTLLVEQVLVADGAGDGEVAPAEAEPTAAALPPLALSIEIDFEGRAATMRLDDASDPVQLVYRDGAWRLHS